ncbi:MAG TPA: CoA transferase [Burkholderiales bacterium]|nr:CoA transferase [Burkholderiales bacterium]
MKLAGIRVVDLSVFLPGPYLTKALADHGAEVIKVEAPGEGDPTRHLGPSDGPSTVYFRNFNRGKKSVVLNLKDVRDRDALLALCGTADVFVETFRPGVVDRLGVGYAQVSARNPRIVYCSISAFGQSGPYRDRPSHDLGVEGVSGVLSVSQGRDGQPAIPSVPAADMVASLQGLAGVLMALLRRQATGQGDFLDISMHDCMVSASANLLGPALAEDRQQVARHERTTGGSAFYQIYDTKDGRHIALAGQEMKFVRNLLGALGRPELAVLCEQGPGPHQSPVEQFLREQFRTRTRDQWIASLSRLDVCFGELNTFPEALRDPQLAARGMVLVDALGRRHLDSPLRFSREPAKVDLREPAMGEHGATVLGRQ